MSDNINTQISTSISAMVLLNSSCQGVVETYIVATDGSEQWYDKVQAGLDGVQHLVRDWRLSGNLYFNQSIVDGVTQTANAFVQIKAKADPLFGQLANGFDAAVQQQLTSLLKEVSSPITALDQSVQQYNSALNGWRIQVEDAQQSLNQITSDVQAQEVKLKSDITLINEQIVSMEEQIKTDRQAISKAKSEEKKGIYETIFGVVFAPFTGGLSLILAGIGVSSIVEAEQAVSNLEGAIKKCRDNIVTDQTELSDDQKQVVSLKALLISVNTVINDCSFITESLEALQTTVGSIKQEADSVLAKLTSATTSEQLIMEKVWFEAACEEWQDALEVSRSLLQASPEISHKTLDNVV
ncbi:alpha-pore-forming cytotoxin MakA [Endozoicomonas atrinae]|uniref:alpha-pore-forming cytotoxin subunit MakE n=1 Tax=Endozoicomonas atrinae TaxID=1333660 RepID=UPI003AFF9361